MPKVTTDEVKPVVKTMSAQKGFFDDDEPVSTKPAPVASKPEPAAAPKPVAKPASKDLFASDDEEDPLNAKPAPVTASKPAPVTASKPEPVTASKPEPAAAPKPVAKPVSKDLFASDDEEDPLNAKPAPVTSASKPAPVTASKPEPAAAPKPVVKPASKDLFASDDEEDPLNAKPAPVTSASKPAPVTASKPEPEAAPKPVVKPANKHLFGSEDEEDSSGPLSTKVLPKPQEAGSKNAGGAPANQDDGLSAEPPKKRPPGAVALFGGVDLFGGEQKLTFGNAGKGNSLKKQDDLFAQASNKPSSPDEDLFGPPVAKKPVKNDGDLFAQPSGKSLDLTTGDDQSTQPVRRKPGKEESPSNDLFDDPLLGARFPTKKIATTSNAEAVAGKMRNVSKNGRMLLCRCSLLIKQQYLVMIRTRWLDHLREP